MKSRWLSIVLILALAVSMCFVLPVPGALAAMITSTAAGGNWATGGTWVGGVAPAVGDTVIIATTGANSVTVGAAVTQTAAGSVAVNSGATLTATAADVTFGALTINSTGIFNCSRVLTVLGATNITGTINLQTTALADVFTGDVTLNSGAVWNETVANTPTFSGNFTNNAATFTASTGAYTFNGAAKILSGSTTISIPTVTFPTGSSYTNNGTLTVGTLLTVTGTGVLTNNGTITATTALSGTGGLTQGATGDLHIGGTSGITTLTATAVGNTVNYTGAAQTAKVTTYHNLTLSGSGAKTFATTPTVNGVLSMEGTATITVTVGVVTYGAAATLQYNTATARTVSSGEWISPFNGSGGVIIKNTGVITLNANKILNNPLTIYDGATLANGGFTIGSPTALNLYCGGATAGSTLSGTGLLTLGGNVIITDAWSGTAGATISCPVALGATRTFTVDNEGTTATDLTMSGVISGAGFGITKAGAGTMMLSALNTFTGAVTINAGILSANTLANAGAGNTSSLGTGAGTAAISIAGAGTLQYTGTGHSTSRAITLTGSGASIDASGSGLMTLSGGITGNTFGLILTGTGQGLESGVIGTTSGTVTMNGTGTWMLSGNSTYIGLTTINAGTIKLGAAGDGTNTPLGTTGSGTVISATGAALDLNGFTLSTTEALTLNGTGVSSGGALTNSSATAVNYNGAITLGSASSIGTTGNITLGAGITGGNDLIKVGAGTLNLGSSTDSLGGLTIGAGTLTSTSGTMNLTGNFTNNSTFTHNSGTVNFNGTAAQILGGSNSTTFSTLTLNNANDLTLGANETVSTTLTLTSGTINTGSNTLTISRACNTPGWTRTSGWVNGNLSLYFPAGAISCTFPIGDASLYDPLVLNFTGIPVGGGNVTASVTGADCSAIGTSAIDPTLSVNHCWTTTSALTGFTNYAATFNYGTGSDVDSGATPASFIAQEYNGGAWSTLTLSGTPSGTITSVTGLTTFGQFAIGDAAVANVISGNVFEDINYTGGAGRNLADSGGTGITGVRVELFNNAGVFQSFTTTNASGNYNFSGVANGTYTVRVVNSSIASTRGGCAAGTCLPVQTFRTNASSGTANPVTDHVGGENPLAADAGNSTLTGAQSFTPVLKNANVTGVDFGFNFDAIVNTNDAGQGSLRQFITNANALTGADTSIFMIPNGAANPGQNTGYANQLTSGGANNGAAVITLTTGALPTISGDSTTLDGTTQTTNVGNTNAGVVGTGGYVGTMLRSLPPFDRPEVVISAAATQLTAGGASVIIKGLAISNGGITVNGSNSQVRDCLCGMDADGTVTTVYGGNFGVQIGAGSSILVSHNYVKINNSGIRGDSPGANEIIEYNEVDSPLGTPGGGQTNTFDGILIVGSASNITVRYNLTKNQRGGGDEFGFGSGAITATMLGNTVVNNGYISAGVASTEGMGIAVYSLATGTAITIQQNIITGNSTVGVAVVPASAALTPNNITITRNSMYNNGLIGIELNSTISDPNNYIYDGVTPNDMNDADTGPNGLLNFPVIESAVISGGNLTLKGWARPGSIIEFFIADADPSNFGEGQTYLTTLTEGSAADTDGTTSTYTNPINGLNQGTDTTNRFSFTIPVPSGVVNGTRLTATATLATNTSEFSGICIVSGPAVTPPLLSVLKSANKSSVLPGEIITYTVKVTNNNIGTATKVTLTDSLSQYIAMPVTSSWTFTDGSPASGVLLGIPAYSSNGGVTYTYSPLVSGAGGAPAGYDGLVTNWKIIMIGIMNGGGANFTINYNMIVK